ncbi:hypothetical protein L249_3196 [Ophiocordyceps polyrhachis-furcata BCC 54312]|uniref:Cyanovirin-N domain-containing protein n=1 Tax=Ophiocordyceps polyrhachis-furcata BCC 54312 TaxID=1330021 RepID=A0A367LRU9_9HYPO|nr:hypothetical protein L249_3196 [Ophiocordyceps polyrhachis-furcata BCC 54312]
MNKNALLPLLALSLGPAAAQLSTRCLFVGFSDGTASRPVAYTSKCSVSEQGEAEVCSQLDLSHCLKNSNGSLGPAGEADGGNFKETCPSCHVEDKGKKLFCVCQREDRTFGYTSVDLDNVIVVKEGDGVLTCSTTVGRQMTECPVTRMGEPPKRRQELVA